MRIGWADTAKAIGILLVLIGHVIRSGSVPWLVIYTFHIPLFFFLSGYLLKEESLRLPAPRFVWRLIRTVVVPYVVFGLLSYLYWLPTHARGASAVEFADTAWYEPLTGLLYGNCETLHGNQVLWFFTSLFSTALFFYVLHRFLSLPSLVACVVILGIAGPLYRVDVWRRPPWNVDVATVAMVFYAAGHLCRRGGWLARVRPRWSVVRVAAMAVCVALLLWSSRRTGLSDISKMRLGDIWYFYLAAFAGIALTVLVANTVWSTRAARWLADNTIVIFPLHPILYGVFTGIGVTLFRQPFTFKNVWYFNVLYVAVALILCVPVAWVFQRWAPSLIGLRRDRAEAGVPV